MARITHLLWLWTCAGLLYRAQWKQLMAICCNYKLYTRQQEQNTLWADMLYTYVQLFVVPQSYELDIKLSTRPLHFSFLFLAELVLVIYRANLGCSKLWIKAAGYRLRRRMWEQTISELNSNRDGGLLGSCCDYKRNDIYAQRNIYKKRIICVKSASMLGYFHHAFDQLERPFSL